MIKADTIREEIVRICREHPDHPAVRKYITAARRGNATREQVAPEIAEVLKLPNKK